MASSLVGLLLAGAAWGQSVPPIRPVAPPPLPAKQSPPVMQYRKEPAAPVFPAGTVRIIQLDDGTLVSQPVAVQPVGMQQPLLAPAADDTEYQIQLTPPGAQRLFRLESERALQERLRQEALQRPAPERIEFPKYDPLTREPFAARSWPLQFEYVEPSYVCYRRLYFEDKNSERYGWDLGFVQPFVSAGKFYLDVLLLPYHAGTDWRRHHECNSGYCLPGDPVPYRLYPHGLSATGAAAQVGAVIALLVIFP
jgi:hypothetical protein